MDSDFQPDRMVVSSKFFMVTMNIACNSYLFE